MPHVGKVEGVKQYSFKQSPFFPHVPKTPFRQAIVSGSNGGKANLLITQVTKFYPEVFSVKQEAWAGENKL